MADDRANDKRRVPNMPVPMVWPKGAMSKEDYEERQTKMYNKYMPDAIESNKEYQARHEAELKEFEGK